jgi:acyl-CoA dehydrogenase
MINFFSAHSSVAIAILFLGLFICIGYVGVPLWGWTLYLAGLLVVCDAPLWGWMVLGILALVFNLPPLRQRLITAYLVKAIAALKLLPNISATEREAIKAGNVWVEGEFLAGKPNFKRLLNEPYPQLSSEAKFFLDHQVETVCRMATDWEIHSRKDLPPEVWDYLRQEGFFGMMIPMEYGGLGFSNLAYSAVMVKLASRSFTHFGPC